jgi:hypothetical protein
MTLRARFDGKVFVPIDPVQMAKDQIVELEVRAAEETQTPRKGSPAALLQLLRSMPRLQPGDGDALERSIQEGKLPVRNEGIFDDLRGE